MQELIIAVLGVAGLIIGVKMFDKYNINKHQAELDKKVSHNDKKQAGLEGEQRQEDKETKRKVDEITNDQNQKLSGSQLVDWFTRRK